MSSNTFRDTIRSPEMASLASCDSEFTAFRASYPLLHLGLFGDDQVAAPHGELEIGIKNYCGTLQATLRVPETDEFAFVEIPVGGDLWGFLESSLSDGTLRWQKPRRRERRKS